VESRISPSDPRPRTLNSEDVGSHPMMPNLVRHRACRAGGPSQELVGPAGTARVIRRPRAAGLAEHHASRNRCPAEPLPSARAASVGSNLPIRLPAPEPGHVFRDMLSGNAEIGPGERLGILPVLPSRFSMKGRMGFRFVAGWCRISPALCRRRWGDDHSGADENEGDGHAHGCRLSFGVSKSRPVVERRAER
jgi:hypothetical protein